MEFEWPELRLGFVLIMCTVGLAVFLGGCFGYLLAIWTGG